MEHGHRHVLQGTVHVVAPGFLQMAGQAHSNPRDHLESGEHVKREQKYSSRETAFPLHPVFAILQDHQDDELR